MTDPTNSDLSTEIWPMPVEIPGAIAFDGDREHTAYDADAAHRFWLALVQINRVFEIFRAGYLGKVSPVHFFWGAMDLAVTRFSGREAPPHPGGAPNCGPHVMWEAYSREVSSAGGIRWASQWVNVTQALQGENVGLEQVEDGQWDVYFGVKRLGRLHERHMRIEDEFSRLRRCTRQTRGDEQS